MPRKVKLILNPMADMGNAWRIANDLRPIIHEYEGSADWSGTVYPGHAIELARQAGLDGYDMVIAVGGDGTVHEVVNGLMSLPEDKRPILGVVPVGSGNDFAHAIGLPMKADHALARALQGEAGRVDIGLMTYENGRKAYFDNTLGMGFDAVVTIRSHKLPLLRGFVMYLAAVIQTILLNHWPIKMQFDIDGQKFERDNLLVALCNGPREGGGFMVAPEAKNNDGLFHYVMVSYCNRLTMFRLVPEVMKGTHGKFKEVTLGSCHSMSLTSNLPLYMHLDGEVYTSFGSNLKQASFELLPGALKVVKGEGIA
jgi:YegS/Rv2252/BmrU family lipid kinase